MTHPTCLIVRVPGKLGAVNVKLKLNEKLNQFVAVNDGESCAALRELSRIANRRIQIEISSLFADHVDVWMGAERQFCEIVWSGSEWPDAFPTTVQHYGQHRG
jgi:hypothetical protein